MASLVIPSFFGSIPRRGDRLLQEQHAVIAENVQARTGYLAGRAADEVRGDVLSDLGYVYRIPNGGTDFFLQFAQQNISVVRGPLANDEYERYYYAGEGDNAGAKFNTKERILAGQNWYDLGVPRFSTRPSLSIAAAGSGTPELRFYVITYCDIYGHESAPTNPRRITCNDDAEILVGWDERDTYCSRRKRHCILLRGRTIGFDVSLYRRMGERRRCSQRHIGLDYLRYPTDRYRGYGRNAQRLPSRLAGPGHSIL
jgi:hypothetical protein